MSRAKILSMITDSNQARFVTMTGRRVQEGVLGGDIVLGTRILLPLRPALHPKLKALDRLHLPVIRAVEIPFGGADMSLSIQSYGRSCAR